MKKENHIKVLEFWTRHKIPYVWDETLSLYQLVRKTIQYLNKVIDDQNELKDIIKEFINLINDEMSIFESDIQKQIDAFIDRFDGNLANEVINVLDEWKQSGDLDKVINEALFNQKLDKEYEALKNINVRDYGAKGDGNTDDSDAFFKAINDLKDKRGYKLSIPEGHYILNKPIYISRRMVITGSGETNTILDFSGIERNRVNEPYNCAVIVVHENNLPNGKADNPIIMPSGQLGDYGVNSVIEHLTIRGSRDTDKRINGLFINAPATVRHVRVDSFNGDGIVIAGTKDAQSTHEYRGILGNANHTKLLYTTAANNARHGIHMVGNNANSFYVSQCNIFSNGYYGIFDNSLIGGLVIACEADRNQEGAYGSSGSFGFHTQPSQTVWVGNYAEGNQPVIYSVNQRHLILGYTGVEPENTNNFVGAVTQRGLHTPNSLSVSDSINDSFDVGQKSQTKASRYGKGYLRLRTSNVEQLFEIGAKTGKNYTSFSVDDVVGLEFPHKNVTKGVRKGIPAFRNGLTIGLNQMWSADSIPTVDDGVQNKGDIILKSNPESGGFIGWVCVSSGVPGVWKEFGKIE